MEYEQQFNTQNQITGNLNFGATPAPPTTGVSTTGMAGGDLPGTTTGTGTTGTGEAAYQRGLGYLGQYAAGESPQQRAIAESYMSSLGARGAAEKEALGQQQAQLGIEGGRASAEQAMLGRDIRGAQADMARDLAAGAQDRAYGAAQQLGAQGLAAANYGQRKAEYGDKKAWDTYEQLLRVGDFDGAANQFEQMHGYRPDVTALKEDRAHMLALQEDELQIGDLKISGMEIGNRAAEFGITDQQMRSGIFAISNGVTDADSLNDMLGTSMTQKEVDNMARIYNLTYKSLANRVGDETASSIKDRINDGWSVDRINDEFPDAEPDAEGIREDLHQHGSLSEQPEQPVDECPDNGYDD